MNRKKIGKGNKKGNHKKREVRRDNRKDIMTEDLMVDNEEGFDEDEDDVTDDTLEFLSLDDEFIESYNRKHGHGRAKTGKKSSVGRYASVEERDEYEELAVYEDEEYEGEESAEYEDEEYEGEESAEYEDAEYEDEEYEGEESAEYEDEEYEGEESAEYEDEEYEDEESAEYEDEEYEDEESAEYEDDEYDDEEYEYGEYEGEDDEYEYDEYEDEDDEEYEYDEDDEEYGAYDDEERDGVIVRIKDFLAHMSTMDMVVAVFGILVVAGVILSGGLYLNAKSVAKQVDAFASVGEEMEGISVIGEGGLLAVSESAKLSGMINLEEEIPEEQEEKPEEDEKGSIEVGLNLTSIQSDLKIKFTNKATGKLIGGVPFVVEVSGAKTFEMKDDDKDGIIYQTGIAAGDYSVKIKPFTDEKYAEYKLPASASSVKVTDTIAYQKVDVTDEVKTEAEVNVAAEDTAQQNTVVESTLTDTVEWVESTKTPIGDEKAMYTEVDKKNIPDPWTVSSAYQKLVNSGVDNTKAREAQTPENPDGGTTENPDPTNPDSGNTGTENPDTQNPDQPKPEEPTPKPVVSISLNLASLSLKTGESGQLTANVENSSNSVSWVSSSDAVAGVDSSGRVTAKAKGSATITATVDGVAATCAIEVTENPQPTFGLNPASLELKTGASADISVVVTNAQIKSVDWKSDNESSVTVNGTGQTGRVTGVKEGNATLSALVTTTDNKTETLYCKVAVKSGYSTVTISGATEVAVGKTITLTAQTDPKDGRITWSSADEKIAKVDDKGVVTGVAEGTVEIKAVCTDATSISAAYKITVKKALDGTTKLKDKDGNQMYYLLTSGEYMEATYDDYAKYDKFYKKSTEASAYKYTGWQTIDGSVYFYDKNGNYVTGEQVIQGAKYSFGSDGKLSSGSGSMGIDVSKWNGNIDWNAVKNSGVSYVIIRCGYRGSSTGALIEDSKFRSNIKGAKAAGLKVGVYFFSQAVNEVEAVEEASMALSLASGYGLNYPIFLDVEASGGRGDSISKETRTAVCKAFCNTVQNSGCAAGIYANKTWFSEKINTASLTGYKIWLAQYASAPTYTATRYDMWQYSSQGKVSGISGNVDMNISYLYY